MNKYINMDALIVEMVEVVNEDIGVRLSFKML